VLPLSYVGIASFSREAYRLSFSRLTESKAAHELSEMPQSNANNEQVIGLARSKRSRIMSRCPRCESGINFETAQRIKQSDGSFRTEIYRFVTPAVSMNNLTKIRNLPVIDSLELA
jgi:hypothetical protein